MDKAKTHTNSKSIASKKAPVQQSVPAHDYLATAPAQPSVSDVSNLRRLQRKSTLKVNQLDDRDEREADQGAEPIMRMLDQGSAVTYRPDLVSRKRTSDNSEIVSRTPTNTETASGDAGGRTASGSEETRRTNLKVFVIGSPSPGEIRARHPLQFVNAAQRQGVDANTVWIVERTGYDAAGVATDRIASLVTAGRLVWLTPESGLVSTLNQFPAGSIAEFIVFSHGVAGHVTLRYGWSEQGLANYGLSLGQVRSLNRTIFMSNARIRFDSCNTGTSDVAGSEGNLAQQFAEQTGQNVEAWTGRTSYSGVNAGTGGVEASQMSRNWRPDWGEVGSRLLGRDPQLRTFSPTSGNRVGGFSAHFEIRRRLPESRKFQVPANGSVAVTCPNPHLVLPGGASDLLNQNSSYTPYGTAVESNEDHQARVARLSGRFWVALYRDEWFGDPSLGMHTFEVQQNSERATWSNLSSGTYYLEVYRLGGHSDYPIRSDMRVEIYGTATQM